MKCKIISEIRLKLRVDSQHTLFEGGIKFVVEFSSNDYPEAICVEVQCKNIEQFGIILKRDPGT